MNYLNLPYIHISAKYAGRRGSQDLFRRTLRILRQRRAQIVQAAQKVFQRQVEFTKFHSKISLEETG